MHRFIKLIRDHRGVAAIEYALIALFIVAAGITTWGAMTSQGNASGQDLSVRSA